MQSPAAWVLGIVRPDRSTLLASLAAALIQAVATACYPILLDLVTTRLIGASASEGALPKVRAAVQDLGFASETWVDGVSRHLFVLFALVVLIKACAQALRVYTSAALGEAAAHRLRVRLFARMIYRAPVHLATTRPGDVYARVLVDVEHIKRAINQGIPGLVSDALRVLGLSVTCIVLHPRLSLGALVILPLSLMSVGLLSRALRRRARRAQAAFATLGVRLTEALAGAEVIASFQAEDREVAGFRCASRDEAQANLASEGARAMHSPLVELIGVAAVLVTALWASGEIAEGRLRPGEVVGFLLALVLIYEPLKGLARVNGIVQPGLAATERVRELLAWTEPVADRKDARPLRLRPYGLQFRNATARYPGQSSDAVAAANVTLSVPSFVALVGPSGGGKSTLLALINRRIEPHQGSVELNGRPLDAWTLSSIRSQVAVVDQNYFLFDGTLEDNLTLGARDSSRKRILDACGRAGLGAFLEALPDGLEAEVGQGGMRLSAGERQRVALARALLRDAPILLLDEPTSALDEANRRVVVQTLLAEARTRMVIVATHDEALIRAASQVVHVSPSGSPPRNREPTRDDLAAPHSP